MGHGTTDCFQIGKGVHQGCILSPCLFNLYAEYIMRNAGLKEAQAGIKIQFSSVQLLGHVQLFETPWTTAHQASLSITNSPNSLFTLTLFPLFPHVFAMKWWDQMPWSSFPERWCCESAALNMPANFENSAVATGLEKVSFHSNPKERQCQRMLKLPHNCNHLTR